MLDPKQGRKIGKFNVVAANTMYSLKIIVFYLVLKKNGPILMEAYNQSVSGNCS